ncbi:hypothetical protein Theos_0553 [Thermus oshimai JL-2]|uniref:Uncharacterized protein n=1 Tax=Thermus oshimai JL-2 TaxID=751945 RepID=K7RGC1_THEOS|nr:hypothetical protein [Thermus oshimai]AFV75617.1 hypothetical protein Theos_0553 [Thermus oshimai JL-2]
MPRAKEGENLEILLERVPIRPPRRKRRGKRVLLKGEKPYLHELLIQERR